MNNESATNAVNGREVLRNWIRGRAKLSDGSTFTDQTLIIQDGLITSIDVLNLILLIEELGNIEIDATELEPHMLESVDMICRSFLE